MSEKISLFRKEVIGWSLYDFANTIYSMNIVSLYLKRYIVEDLGYDDRWFDIPFSFSMLLAALILPALGAISDHSTRKRIFLLLFTITCCIAVGIMQFVPSDMILGTIVLFIIANFAYEAGQPFYNSLLYSVERGKKARFVSGIGVALGYVGSIVGMLLVLPFVSGLKIDALRFSMGGGGKTASFLPTAILFALFSIPLFLWVKEKKSTTQKSISFINSYWEVWEGIKDTKKYRGVLRFLVADYFVEDAVTTVILNIGLYCSVVLLLSDQQITSFLILSTVSAVGGSFLIGKIAENWSLKKLLELIMTGWVVALILFVVTDNMTVIWILGSVIGILLGGLWTTTRPMLAELVPKVELGKFFGLFALSGRAAAIVGPLVWTLAVYLFQTDRPLGRFTASLLNVDSASYAKLPYKMSVLSLTVMMLIGLWIFRKLPETEKKVDE